MFVVAQFKGKEGILLQSTKAIVRRDLTGRSTMRWETYLKRYGTLYLLLLVPLAFFIIFRYVPMSYILLAFKKNNILKAPWRWIGRKTAAGNGSSRHSTIRTLSMR